MKLPPTKSRINKAVADFVQTLGDFCELVLDNGTEVNGEWVIPDLQNSEPKPGKLGSCSINLSNGKWYDHNPAANPHKGGAVRLWSAIFGVLDTATIVAGMEAWVREGRLPGGQGIGVRPEPTVIKKSEPKAAARHSKEEQAKWLKTVEANTPSSRETAEILAEWRGLSTEVFDWMIQQGYLAIYNREYTTKKGRIFFDQEIAFPVFQTCKRGLSFYGMHVKWLGYGGNHGWKYVPKGKCPALSFVIGDLPNADLVVLGESTWDVISYIDLYDLHTWSVEDGRWAAIVTRGASNVKHVPFNQIKPSAHVELLRQNDEADAKFLKLLPESIRSGSHHIIPPDEHGYKDLNDWMRDASRETIKQSLQRRF